MKEFDRLLKIMETLRGENGCPWDREQTFDTLKTFLIEEAYELIESIDNKDMKNLCEELGDLQLQIVFMCQIAREEGLFTIEDSLRSINEKMIRRHPHVFGEDSVKDSGEVLENWEKIKSQERKKKKTGSFFSGIASTLPSLQTAYQIGVKSTRVGFDWDTPEQVEEKVKEEWDEYRRAKEENNQEKIREELGDMLFTLAHLARKHGIDPEDALRLTNRKFLKRFAHIEKNTDIHNSSLDEMEMLWKEAKKLEKHDT